MTTQHLDYTQAYHQLKSYISQPPPKPHFLNHKKHQLEISDPQTGSTTQIFRFPLPFAPIAPDEFLWAYAERVQPHIPNYCIVLIQAGSAALGYFEQGEMVQHKVIKKYMVRAKQGRAELLQQKIKPRHSEGSRLRLQNSYRFFEEINEKLQLWQKNYPIERFFYTCPIHFLQHWTGAKPPPPFDKRSPNALKIPLDIAKPNLEILVSTNKACLMAKHTHL